MVDLSGITLPFGVGDMISGGMGLIAVVGPFILIGLALIFAPLIIVFIKDVFELHSVSENKSSLYSHVLYKRTGGLIGRDHSETNKYYGKYYER
ncbi:MAG TPA: hypothetical protein GX525_11955 [Bacilli bacterium]|nr:hypothetical protein [Bacilli bacterium]